MANSFDLDRFIMAQAGIIEDALEELRAGEKRSHWMWFVFPQLRGLGISATAQRYGMTDLREAQAYLKHPLLGQRLIVCTQAVLSAEGRTIHEIFGSPDDLKFHSSMTLFAIAADGEPGVFQLALDRLFNGVADARTVAMLSA